MKDYDLTIKKWFNSIVRDKEVYKGLALTAAIVPAAAAINDNPEFLTNQFAHVATNLGAIYALGKTLWHTALKYEAFGTDALVYNSKDQELSTSLEESLTP